MMTKFKRASFLWRIMPAFLLFSWLVLPFATVSPAGADTNGWTSVQTQNIWNYDGYRVERLAVSKSMKGPFLFGDRLVFALSVGNCGSTCSSYDLYLFSGGVQKVLARVPAEAIFHRSPRTVGTSIIGVNPIPDKENHFTISSYDLIEGGVTVLGKDVFLNGAGTVGVMKDGTGPIFFNQTFDFGTTLETEGYHQAAVSVWDTSGREATILNRQGTRLDEELIDVHGNLALVKMVFEGGQAQLWLYDGVNNTVFAIPGSWTIKGADLTKAHFRSDGSVEFFQNFSHFIYDITKNSSALDQKHLLTWFRSPEHSVQIVGDRMAWVNPDDTLYVSDLSGTREIGTATEGRFLLTDQTLYRRIGNSTEAYDLKKGEAIQTIPFIVTDDRGNVVVGNDESGTIWYMNRVTNKLLSIGQGSNPRLSDEQNLFWRGNDGSVFEASIFPSAHMGIASTRAVREDGSSDVYLILDDRTAALIPNERVFSSWFSSWDVVETVSPGTISTYQLIDQAAFAPGTKVQIFGDKKLYLAGVDGKLHWMSTESIANAIFGKMWNKNIVTIRQDDLPFLLFGKQILTEADLQGL